MLTPRISAIARLQTPDTRHIAGQIAHVLGWADEQMHERLVGVNGSAIGTAHIEINQQPAGLIGYISGVGTEKHFRNASEFAYNRAVRWGVICDAEGVQAFNSHVIKNGIIARSQKISWDDPINAENILEKFLVPGLAQSRPSELLSPPTDADIELRTVDDELVTSLDRWRVEALRYSDDVVQIDERLQSVYAQFFVLRTIEDRKINFNGPSLRDAIRDDQLDRNMLATILRTAQNEICADLYSSES